MTIKNYKLEGGRSFLKSIYESFKKHAEIWATDPVPGNFFDLSIFAAYVGRRQCSEICHGLLHSKVILKTGFFCGLGKLG